MPSPFPGMDPYLEGYLWPDVHQRLATEISDQLTPRLRPRYVARLAITVFEDREPQAEIGIMYPDVEVVQTQPKPAPQAPRGDVLLREAPTPAPLTIPLPTYQVKLVSVEIRDAAQNELVTSIEILSPVNKRGEGLVQYRQKRERLHEARVHLLEIDLLRRGKRPFAHPRIPDTPYLVSLLRAEAAHIELWPIRLQATLPIPPVPLRTPDPDLPLNLSTALAAIYDRAAYDLSIDYTEDPPPPPLSPEDAAWMQRRLADHRASAR